MSLNSGLRGLWLEAGGRFGRWCFGVCVRRPTLLLVLAAPAAGAQQAESAVGAQQAAAGATAASAAAATTRITITGTPVEGQPASRDDAPGSVLTGPALRSRAAATLGATLADEPGVGNASFGPNVGQPLIRGQGGARVRVLQNGIGTHDASALSADHGVMLEPALAEQVVVHRGPAAIRYGGAAIGGAVEVDERRIPLTRPQTLRGRAEARAGGDGRLGLVRLDGPAGEQLAWHLDAHGRHSPDARIPGWAIDEDAIRSQFQLVNARNSLGRVENSDARTEGGAIGLGRVSAQSAFGVSLSRLTQNYGIPPGAHSHAGAAATGAGADEAVRIAASQRRVDVQGEFDVAGQAATQLRTRVSQVNYEHSEVDAGLVATQFRNRVLEGRVEVDHQWRPGRAAQVGLQWQDRFFSALGREAFVPMTQVRAAGLFGTAQGRWGPWQLDAGLRADYQQSRPAPTFDVPALGGEVALQTRRFWPGSASMAVQRRYGPAAAAEQRPDAGPGGALTLTHWRLARAPDVQELFAGGAHIATRSFDLGNNGLDTEKLVGWDLGWQHRQGAVSVRANVYRYDSDSYIYQRSLGWFYRPEEGKATFLCVRLDHCLPATKYEQAAARLQGYELELSWQLPLAGGPKLALFSDGVRARLADGGDVPRQPPQRHGLYLQWRHGGWYGDLRATRARAQRRAGDNETPTAGYLLLNASLRWTLPRESGGRTTLFLVGRNLADREIRNSASFLRNYAPEPGRSVHAGVEVAL